MAAPNPALWFVCMLNEHDWRVFTRYSWALRVRLLLGERCARCGARRGPSFQRDYSRAR